MLALLVDHLYLGVALDGWIEGWIEGWIDLVVHAQTWLQSRHPYGDGEAGGGGEEISRCCCC